MGKPVAPQFRQMVSKIQDLEISSRNRVYHLYKSVPFTENDHEGPKLVSKMGLKKWNTNFCLEYPVQ